MKTVQDQIKKDCEKLLIDFSKITKIYDDYTVDYNGDIDEISIECLEISKNIKLRFKSVDVLRYEYTSTFDSLGKLDTLEHANKIFITDTNLKSIDFLKNLKSVNVLELYINDSLENIDGIKHLDFSKTELFISGCKFIDSVNDEN